MAPKIQHKRSAVAGKAPQPADLDYGEIGVNYEATDPALYIKDSADAIRKIGNQPDASETTKGIIELATAAETTTGTDNTRAVHPAGLKVELDKKANQATTYTKTETDAALALKADLASPALTGVPTAPTAAAGTNTTQLATTEFVTAAVAVENLWDRTGTVVSPTTAGDVVSISAGTAALPGLTPVGDPNTGIYSPGADQMALSTGGTGRLFVDASGRLGLGATANTWNAGQVIDFSGAKLASFWNPGDGFNALSNVYYDSAFKFASTGGYALYYQQNAGSGDHIFATSTATATANGVAAFTELVRITASGHVGISSPAPRAPLDVVGGAPGDRNKPAVFIQNNKYLTLSQTSGNWGLSLCVDSANNSHVAGLNSLIFSVGTTGDEAARLDQQGRLLVGTSTALSNVSIAGTLGAPTYQIQGATGAAASASVTRTTAGSAFFTFNAGSSGNNVASGNGLGLIQFNGFDGTNYINGASIGANVDGTPGASDMPGRLVFSTCPSGSASPVERMMIKNTGAIRYVTAFTVATLPAGEVGDLARVTDANAPAVGSTVAGGGAANALCWYNGANWTVMGV